MLQRVVILAILLVGFSHLAALQHPTCDPLPYEVYWNVQESVPAGLNLSQYSIFPANFTQTGSGCSTPNCHSWSQGQFPTISDSGKTIYGGVPQNSNLTAHLEVLRKTVESWIPDPDWDGNAVLDFEAWTTVWYLNNAPPKDNWHSSRYINYSLVLEIEEHPDYSPLEQYSDAKNRFETSATEFFVESLKTLHSSRPKAKWGFYGLPMNFINPCEGSGKTMVCGYQSTTLGPLYSHFSDKQQPIWQASTALYPSIYIPAFRTADENAAYVRSVVKETVRCAAGKIPVYAFQWNYYHNGSTLLDLTDLQSSLLIPYDEGARGIVMWGDNNGDAHTEYVKKYVGPIVEKFVAEMCECSQSHCSGHGRCMPSTSTDCECYPGYSGTHCEQVLS